MNPTPQQTPFEQIVASPLERDPSSRARRRPRLTLFWRSFFLIAVLLSASLLATVLYGTPKPADAHDFIIPVLLELAVLLGAAALIAYWINQPFTQLSQAVRQIRDGDFAAGHLDEKAAISELRQININVNRMAQQLSKVEQDRALMLAGISHDLRTPLARLRLETEMSVADPDALSHIAADIAQMDGIISKFVDYARPDHIDLQPVPLSEVIEACKFAVHDYTDMQVRLFVPDNLWILGDRVELTRVISNLLENARRYGKTPETGIALVDVIAKERSSWVLLVVQDHGKGVAADALSNLTKPFYRGDTARTAAVGTGLGLSIVDRNIQRMGGSLRFLNIRSGGLAAHMRMTKVAPPADVTA